MHVVRIVAPESRAARQIDDDPTAAFAEVADGLAAEMSGRDEVDFHGAIPGCCPLLKPVIYIRGLVYARVIDEHIYMAPPVDGLLPDIRHVRTLGEVAGDEATAIGTKILLQISWRARRFDVVQHDIASRADYRPNDCRADAPAAARHQHDLANQVNHPSLPEVPGLPTHPSRDPKPHQADWPARSS